MVHGLTLRLPVAIARGPFAEDADTVEALVEEVVCGLAPIGVQERAEVLHIAALYVRLHRLLGLESAAMTSSKRASVTETVGDLADPYGHLDDATGAERYAGRR